MAHIELAGIVLLSEDTVAMEPTKDQEVGCPMTIKHLIVRQTASFLIDNRPRLSAYRVRSSLSLRAAPHLQDQTLLKHLSQCFSCLLELLSGSSYEQRRYTSNHFLGKLQLNLSLKSAFE
jgi:hypothetical protein